MAMSTSSESDNPIFYENCNSKDVVDGITLETIVGIAMQRIGLDNDGSENFSKLKDSEKAQAIFEEYCSKISKKLGNGEPYYRYMKMSNRSIQAIASLILDLLPSISKTKKSLELVNKIAAEVAKKIDQPTVLFKYASKEFVLAQFSIMKIFQSGQNLEIIPCCLKVHGKRKEMGIELIFDFTQCEMSVTYEQRKYVLNVFQIQAIIKKCKDEAAGFLDD